MIKALQNHLKSLFEVEETPNEENTAEMAAAALMMEVATIDQQLESAELKTLANELSQQFNVPSENLDKLVANAQKTSKDATSLYPFTRYINDHLNHQEKFDLLCGLWRVAFADATLDKYEEYMIRKIADLLYMPQAEFIRAKQLARPA